MIKLLAQFGIIMKLVNFQPGFGRAVFLYLLLHCYVLLLPLYVRPLLLSRIILQHTHIYVLTFTDWDATITSREVKF